MRMLGAKVIVTPKAGKGTGMVRKAEELAAKHGAGKAIKAARPDVKIVLAEPEDAGLLKSGIGQERNEDGSPAATPPAFKPHPIQGWTPDFVPKVLEDAPSALLDSQLLPIPAASAIATAKDLASKE